MGEDVEVKKTLAIAEVPVLSIQEWIKDNGGQMAVCSQKLEPTGDLSFQVFAMNNDDDHGDNTEETDHSVMAKVILKDWIRNTNCSFNNCRWRERMQYIKRFTITMATLTSALSLISLPSVHTANTSFGACLEIRATGARYAIKIKSSFLSYLHRYYLFQEMSHDSSSELP